VLAAEWWPLCWPLCTLCRPLCNCARWPHQRVRHVESCSAVKTASKDLFPSALCIFRRLEGPLCAPDFLRVLSAISPAPFEISRPLFLPRHSLSFFHLSFLILSSPGTPLVFPTGLPHSLPSDWCHCALILSSVLSHSLFTSFRLTKHVNSGHIQAGSTELPVVASGAATAHGHCACQAHCTGQVAQQGRP
jgi:hypothetical protein